ncbi:MAG: sulfurtransferase [Planctomycetota bacterium]|nr:sulfurtransferase [Planctomycetota bacterium]
MTTTQTTTDASVTDKPVVNVAAYRFVTLNDLPTRQAELRELCSRLELKGTILLSEEGVNLFVAGGRTQVDEFLKTLRSDELLASLEVKESFSERQPFTRMVVKIKDEIIAFGVDGVDPRRRASPKLSATELKKWLDEGRAVTLLDTRNDYEVDLGTFRNAVAIGVDNFREFPDAVAKLSDELKQQPVVMFCTGGIRCEKAGPFMEQAGFENIFQLDGGILKYFEECGGEHYDGDCFVFDQRVALNPNLEETEYVLCFACQEALSREDRRSPKYVPDESCPHCYRTSEEKSAEQTERRHARIRELTTPLPGSVPYDNHRPINVPGRFAGLCLIDFLVQWHPQISRDEWHAIIEAGRIIQKSSPTSADRIVREGERFDHLVPATIEPDVNADIRILHEDDSIVVVDKPAPLPMHPCGRFNRNSLEYILNEVYSPEHLRVAHRLDANTSGVVVFCRTRTVARKVQPLFASREVSKVYVARIQGHPQADEFDCQAAISARPQENGLRLIDKNGLDAETQFRVLSRFDDGTALVEARPVTGRTNQIRVHLWKLGLPICGDLFYLPGGATGSNKTLEVGMPPLCLHAKRIEFCIPGASGPSVFDAPAPDWAQS